MVLEIDENENSSVFRGRIHLFMCPPCVSDNPKIQSPRGKKKNDLDFSGKDSKPDGFQA